MISILIKCVECRITNSIVADWPVDGDKSCVCMKSTCRRLTMQQNVRPILAFWTFERKIESTSEKRPSNFTVIHAFFHVSKHRMDVSSEILQWQKWITSSEKINRNSIGWTRAQIMPAMPVTGRVLLYTSMVHTHTHAAVILPFEHTTNTNNKFLSICQPKTHAPRRSVQNELWRIRVRYVLLVCRWHEMNERFCENPFFWRYEYLVSWTFL